MRRANMRHWFLVGNNKLLWNLNFISLIQWLRVYHRNRWSCRPLDQFKAFSSSSQLSHSPDTQIKSKYKQFIKTMTVNVCSRCAHATNIAWKKKLCLELYIKFYMEIFTVFLYLPLLFYVVFETNCYWQQIFNKE